MEIFYQKRENESWAEYYKRCPNACHVEWDDDDFLYYEKLVIESYLINLGFVELASDLRFNYSDDEWEITHCNF